MDIADVEGCYRAVKSRDRRFDGVFYTGVTSTGIYCRPSCPARTPALRHVTFHRTAAGAQSAGFRACKRCLPDATPGSPEWDVSADAAGRAMRLVNDGVVEREGVQGLAARVGYTPRHLHRVLVTELGAGPLALARARRADQARVLVETTGMPFADVAFAAGFASVRQFNETVREVYASTPTELRARSRRRPGEPTSGRLDLRLPVRAPYAAEELLRFLAAHLVPGVEASGPDWYERTLDLPHGAGRVRITLPGDGRVDEGADDGAHDGVDDGAHDGAHDGVDGPGSESAPTGVVQLRCLLQVQDLRDVGAAVERCRRLLDADCDPVAVSEELSGDPWLAGLVRHRPGLRVPGAVDGPETAVRAVLGQQISLLGAVSLGGKLVAAYGRPVPRTDADSPATGATGPDRLFPRPEDLAEVDPQRLPMVRARARALVGLCAALAAGEVPLDRSADRAEVRRRLLALPGIGPWTADYVALRALGDPDVFLPTDLGVRRALAARGVDPASTDELSRGWRPWRSYALLHLWSTLELPVARPRPTPMKET